MGAIVRLHASRHGRGGIGTAVALGLATAAVIPAAADARPRLALEATAAQGSQMVATVEPKRARRCSLETTDPRGLVRRHRLPGGRAYAIRFQIRSRARTGAWELRLRCAPRGASVASPLQVAGARPAGGSSLMTSVAVRRFARRLPRGFVAPARNQQSAGGPAIDPVELDGLGSIEGDRGRGAIEWALSKLGDTSYNFWCLRFVAHAFGAPFAGFNTAQIAADRLGTRDRGLSPAAAPAGALVFFRYVGRDGVSYGHVGISLGDGRMVHAVATVRVERIDGAYWRSRYLGWAFAPATWPGRPPSTAPAAPSVPSPPPASSPAPPQTTTPTPAPPPRRIITVDNRVTNGMGMREDSTPVRLTTKPWIRCSSRGCNINGTERSTGGTYDAAVCQTTGERTTNGNDSDPSDDGNPLRFESTRYYGVRLASGTFGYVSEVWIRAADRGGLGLPAC